MKKNGFTLLELIVVMAIIGILSTMIIGNFVTSQMRARDTKRKNDLTQIQRALEQYINDHGTYPLSSDTTNGGTIVGCGANAQAPESCAWGSEFSLGNPKTIYMIELPEDTRAGTQYVYRSQGTRYQIYMGLENEEDKDYRDYSAFVDCGNYPCSYGVSSTNVLPSAESLN